MKKFLLQVVFLVFLPVGCMVSFCEWSLRRIPNDYSYKDQCMAENRERVNILSFGSSHGYYGIRPDCFSRTAFNLGYISQSIKYDYFLYFRYATRCDSLQYVILPVDYCSLRSELEDGSEYWRVKGYCIYMGCNYHRGEIRYNLELATKGKIRNVIPSLTSKEKLSYISCDQYGFGLGYSKANRDTALYDSGVRAAKRHTHADTKYVADNTERIEFILQDCQLRGVNVILLTTPTYHSYYDLLEKEQCNEFIAACQQWEQRYPNVVYIDYLRDSNFVAEDFFDADHLNECGAQKLTTLLEHYINKP